MDSTPLDPRVFGKGDRVTVKVSDQNSPEDALKRLMGLSATNRIEEMEENLENEFFLFDGLALAGQMTLFYAKPNTGKTLIFMSLIIDAIDSNRVTPEDIFYINADDNYRGLLTKSKIAAQHGFNMISPADSGETPSGVLDLFTALAVADQVAGKVVIIDTLKKFVDMMNKRGQSEFYEVLRTLVTKNASVIIAGHANKHLDHEGHLVYEGTADTMNDIDCMYSIYKMSDQEDERQIVEFRNEKNRGDNTAKVSYSYKKRRGVYYADMVASVSKLNEFEADRAVAIKAEHDLKEEYQVEILFTRELLESSGKALNQKEIIEALKGHDLAEEITIRNLKTALRRLDGIEWEATRDKTRKNALFFELITTSGKDYINAKYQE